MNTRDTSNASSLIRLGQRPHVDGVLGHQRQNSSKTLFRVDLFENDVFMLSCGRVKAKLFEIAHVTASIYDVSEHAYGSLGITEGHFVCRFFCRSSSSDV